VIIRSFFASRRSLGRILDKDSIVAKSKRAKTIIRRFNVKTLKT